MWWGIDNHVMNRSEGNLQETGSPHLFYLLNSNIYQLSRQSAQRVMHKIKLWFFLPLCYDLPPKSLFCTTLPEGSALEQQHSSVHRAYWAKAGYSEECMLKCHRLIMVRVLFERSWKYVHMSSMVGTVFVYFSSSPIVCVYCFIATIKSGLWE